MSAFQFCMAKPGGWTDSLGELAHGIVADIEVSKALAFYETQREGREQVVGEGEPGCVSVSCPIGGAQAKKVECKRTSQSRHESHR